MNASRWISTCIAAALFAGCGGGGGTAPKSLPATTTGPTSSKTPLAYAHLTIKYAANFRQAKKAAGAAKTRTPAYVNPQGYNIDIFVNGTDETAGTTASATSDGTQAFVLPLYSTAANQFVAVETGGGPGNSILAIGETDIAANSFALGDAPNVGITMAMNAIYVGLMSDPQNAYNDAQVGSPYSYGICSLPSTATLYPFVADYTGGFLVSTSTGNGLGPVVPTLTSWKNDPGSPNNYVAAVTTGLNTGYNLTFQNYNGGITLNFSAVNPAAVIANDVYEGYGAYPGIANLSDVLNLFTWVSPYSTTISGSIDVEPYFDDC